MGWLIDKHALWRASAIALVTVTAVGGAGLAFIIHRDQQREADQLRQEVDAFKRGNRLEYEGVRLGMSQDEVRYALGEPNDKHAREKDSPEIWTYSKETSEEQKKVAWNEENRVTGILCSGHAYSFECDSIAGIQIGDTEAEILARFGQPERPPLIADGSKNIVYGTSEVEVKFMLKQDRIWVVMLRAGQLLHRGAQEGG
ncbi:MAG: hypothetical protein ABIY55_12115 [Kofleriaceae bacterium]